MADYALVQAAYQDFFGLTTAGAVPIGSLAEATLPPPEDLRRSVGIVAHTFSTPLPAVWRMTLRELAE